MLLWPTKDNIWYKTYNIKHYNRKGVGPWVDCNAFFYYNMGKKNERGIFIPEEFEELDCLSFTEMGLLGLYRGFTNKDKVCFMTIETLQKKFHCSRKTITNMNEHLSELGFIKIIRTPHYNKVVYLEDNVVNYTKSDV